jgi:hypothetical protein
MSKEARTEENRLGSEPAFPVPIASAVDGSIYNSIQQSGGENGGLTKREVFAAMMLQGFASQPDEVSFDVATPEGAAARLALIRDRANAAVEWADALLKELAR